MYNTLRIHTVVQYTVLYTVQYCVTYRGNIQYLFPSNTMGSPLYSLIFVMVIYTVMFSYTVSLKITNQGKTS